MFSFDRYAIVCVDSDLLFNLAEQDALSLARIKLRGAARSYVLTQDQPRADFEVIQHRYYTHSACAPN